MDLRRFESFNLQDAIKLVKNELGKDAVIISTREKEVYSKELNKNCKMFEVTAAPNVSEQSKIISPKLAEHLPTVDFPRIKQKNEATVVKSIKKDLGKEQLLTKDFKTNQHNEQENLELNTIKQELARVRKEIELLPQIDVVEQMQEIKILLHDMMREKFKNKSNSAHPYIVDIGVRLRTAGVYENFISQLVSWLGTLQEPKTDENLIQNPDLLKDFYLTSTIKFIFKFLKVTGNFASGAEKTKQKIICFVGPTGVGKTTTLAKIAARLKIHEGKSVELISMDSFRVAAGEQLRAYSKILESNFSEVSDRDELTAAISKRSSADFILIDTAGRSVRVPEQVESLKRIAELPLPIEFHLVLSSSMKQRDIDEMVRAFKFLSPSSLIFTKLDESWAFGEILNTSIQNKIPLSYFTTGQRVPEDLELSSKERVVERILKL